jgi:hypothetical protein
MTLSEPGQSRVRGYLFILERSLRMFLPRDIVNDAVKEVKSHILERVSQASDGEDERAAVERVLAELGPPLRVAQAYSTELRIEEAVATGGAVAVLRAALLVAGRTVGGFLTGIVLFTGYALGVGFIAIALLKPVFPSNVGWFVRNGRLNGFGALFPAPPDSVIAGGYWVIPFSLAVGLAVLLGTHRVARAWLTRKRERDAFLTAP